MDDFIPKQEPVSPQQPEQQSPEQQTPKAHTQFESPPETHQSEQEQQIPEPEPEPESHSQSQPTTTSATSGEAPQQLFGFTTNARTKAPSITKSNILEAIKDFDSSIPDAVVNHFLNVAGMQTSDQRIIRLIAIAAQKFIHDIVSDSLQHCKLRSTQGKKTKEKKYTLAIEDLASALAEYGIEVRRQHYFN